MGLDYFYGNESNQNNNNSIIRSMYFGDLYGEQPKKRSFSNDKYDINKKSIDIYFPNKSQIYANNNNNSNLFYSIKKEDDSPNNSSSSLSSSSNEDTKKINNLINKNEKEKEYYRKNENIRKSYYQKLMNKFSVNLNKEIIKNNTIFIFDWDDTLFFTTHINPSKNTTFFYESKTEKRLMNKIEYYVAEILNKALSKGTVLIITNSSDGWVHSCAQFYYPNLLPILDQIKIISARELYQSQFPTDPIMWKVKTFNDLKQKFNFEKCVVSNLICIGDDNSEIIAAKKLGESYENCLVKTIKFRDKPNLTELIKQIILINEQILRVYNYPKSLTIYVDKKKNPNK